MRLKAARGTKVVNLVDAETVGTVDGYVIDPARHAIVALRLGKVSDDHSFLSWTALQAFGPDAVTVAGADRLRPVADDLERRAASKDLQVVGKPVLTQSGNALGKIEDAEFDPESGAIVAFHLDTGAVTGDRLIGVGSYAVVVADAPA
jgi:uncharacterized protein YrrD